jgi:predicted kinase
VTSRPVLAVLSGLSGTGKSTIANSLAGGIAAVWLGIDTIEQAIRDSGVLTGPVNDAGYRAAQGVATEIFAWALAS